MISEQPSTLETVVEKIWKAFWVKPQEVQWISLETL